jgi:hypothetical protein
MPPDLFTVSNPVGLGNGKFLGDVANGMSRDELIRRWKAGEYPDLHEGLARDAMKGRT